MKKIKEDEHLRHLLLCRWRVLKPITNMPAFQGTHWSALLRHAYNPFLKPSEAFHETGLRPIPLGPGGSRFRTGQRLTLALSLPGRELDRLAKVLGSLQHARGIHGHLEPGNTLTLESVFCCLSRQPWPERRSMPFSREAAAQAIDVLCRLRAFRLHFTAPLRLKRPPGGKRPGGRYCDPAWFSAARGALGHVISQLAPGNWAEAQDLVLSGIAGHWQDVPFGRTTKPTTLGGFVGMLQLEGRVPPRLAWSLILGQFLGIGKNRAFGLGLYRIPEIAHLMPVFIGVDEMAFQ